MHIEDFLTLQLSKGRGGGLLVSEGVMLGKRLGNTVL